MHRPDPDPMTSFRSPLAALALFCALASPAAAQDLSAADRARVDSAAVAVLAATGAPSASLAIVRGGRIVYEQAYGDARVEPQTTATPAMRYAIGSVSKQFTAAAVLLLAEEGRLSLDDPVSRWFPDLTRASEITLRHLLSMTSGYQDYWPQDYVWPDMQRPAAAQEIMRRWAGKALDFDPGTRWQYSNTNYVIAAAIVERVSGMPFMDFLRRRIFTPLGMTSVADHDAGPLTSTDAAPLLRNGLGPLRHAPKEGRGWLFGAAQLAMTAHDLALWDIAVMDRALLRQESYRAQQTDMLLSAGTATGYGLGVSVGTPGGRRRISHGGAVSGYTTSNAVYPDDRAAIVVFTNIYPGAAGAPGRIAGRIAGILFPPSDTAAAAAETIARRLYDMLARGTVDRDVLSPNANAYFTPEALADYAASLGPLGPPSEFERDGASDRGGMRIRSYSVRAGGRTMALTMMVLPDGKLDQYIVERAN